MKGIANRLMKAVKDARKKRRMELCEKSCAGSTDEEICYCEGEEQ